MSNEDILLEGFEILHPWAQTFEPTIPPHFLRFPCALGDSVGEINIGSPQCGLFGARGFGTQGLHGFQAWKADRGSQSAQQGAT